MRREEPSYAEKHRHPLRGTLICREAPSSAERDSPHPCECTALKATIGSEELKGKVKARRKTEGKYAGHRSKGPGWEGNLYTVDLRSRESGR